MRTFLASMTVIGVGGLSPVAQAQHPVELRTKVTVNKLTTQGVGPTLGSVEFADSQEGLVIQPSLTGLPPGTHGFHVHENASCDALEKDGKMVPGLAAGGHYDPQGTKSHSGPDGKPPGHLGDLPALVVKTDGSSTAQMFAPRLKIADLRGRSLVVHAGGDTYGDKPQPDGGGGDRIACGVFEIKMAR